jgi:hypothetical protein
LQDSNATGFVFAPAALLTFEVLQNHPLLQLSPLRAIGVGEMINRSIVEGHVRFRVRLPCPFAAAPRLESDGRWRRNGEIAGARNSGASRSQAVWANGKLGDKLDWLSQLLGGYAGMSLAAIRMEADFWPAGNTGLPMSVSYHEWRCANAAGSSKIRRKAASVPRISVCSEDRKRARCQLAGPHQIFQPRRWHERNFDGQTISLGVSVVRLCIFAAVIVQSTFISPGMRVAYMFFKGGRIAGWGMDFRC